MKFKVVSPESQNSSGTGQGASERIQSMLDQNPVFLFMKGNPDMPQCGFSAKVTQIMRSWNIPFESFDVLSDHEIREGVKSYSNWPTIPQLYINKSFVGGCDIITELSETGELLPLLKEVFPDREFTPPPPPAKIKEITPEIAAEQMKNKTNARLIDVRSPEEWDYVHLENAQLIDEALVEEMLSSWERSTPLILLCHHGNRSRDAARFFIEQGFQDVSNVDGGIDGWAKTVDTALPLYQ
ncbi:MAG: Grx4 family monothiol glutaredoxin [SAR324 cluster bacterium]|nr:Grx4 family monothiol glutaredoxin [SAR324 cluster bacterium]